MTDNPDPLAANPEVKSWAEKFYAVMSWQMPDTSLGVEGLDTRRKSATDALAKIVIGPELMPGARRAFDGGRKALQNAANSAATLDPFDQIDLDIVKLANDITAQIAIAKARAASNIAQDQAFEKFNAISALLDEGSFTFLQTKLRAAQDLHSKAVSKGEFEAAAKAATDFLPLCNEAEKYGAFFGIWESASIAFLATAVDVGDKDAMTALRITKMKAARTASLTGDFATAKSALEEWAADGKVGTDAFDKAAAFTKAMLDYLNTHEEDCKEVLNSGINSAKAFKAHPKEIKKLAYTNKNYDAALVKLTELTTWAVPRKQLAIRMRRFDSAMQKEKAFRDAMAEMNNFDAADKINEAIATLDTLEKNKALMKVNYSSQVSKKLGNRYEALKKLIVDPELTDLTTTWTKHEDHVQKGEFDAASVLVIRLNKLFRLEKMVDDRAELASLFLSTPGAEALDYHADFKTALAKPDYNAALAALKIAMPLIRKIPAYAAARDEMVALKSALAGNATPLHDTLDTALNDAKLLAEAKQADAAATHLRQVMEGADYLGLAMELADYKLKSAEIAKRHAKARKLLGLSSAQDVIDLSLAAAEDLAQKDGKFAQSYLALQKHGDLLTQAQGFGTAHRQAVGVISGLRRAETTTANLFSGLSPDLDDLDDAFKLALGLATKAKFSEAKIAFDKILTDAAILNKKAAENYETLDGAGSNAGHSLDRHGPGLTDEELILRLKTGTPPNAHPPETKSYTGASSSFDSAADWLAGRELAAKHAETKGIDLAATELKPPFDKALTSSEIIVEHGRAIDKAFIGVKKEKRFDEGTQSFIDDKTYETFEELNGLTRAYVNFLWEFEIIADVPKVDKDDKPVLDSKGDAVLGDHKAQDATDYIEAWTRKTGLAPTQIKGRWVMMQQYPVADGWDNTLKAYTNEPKGMIP